MTSSQLRLLVVALGSFERAAGRRGSVDHFLLMISMRRAKQGYQLAGAGIMT